MKTINKDKFYCTKCYYLTSPDSPFRHEKSTVNEQAVDIFTVNKSERKIYVTRIGVGEDREYTY